MGTQWVGRGMHTRSPPSPPLPPLLPCLLLPAPSPQTPPPAPASRRPLPRLTCNPVHGDALHAPNAVGHHVLAPRLIALRSADGAEAHVHPVNGVIFWGWGSQHGDVQQGRAKVGGQTHVRSGQRSVGGRGWGAWKGKQRGVGTAVCKCPLQLRSGCPTLHPQKHTTLEGHALPSNGSPAWKSMPTAREVPDTGTRASDLSLGSRGIPRIPSCTEYRRKEPTPETRVL